MAYLELCNVGLDLPIYDIQGRSLKKRLMRLGRRNELAEKSSGVIVVNALAGINLRLDSGDRVGLIGHNGAGKSTLLRLLAGIYAPTSGSIEKQGKAVPLLDISLGMDENSTGYQNIRLRGLLLGMTNAEIRNKERDIAEFTGLSDSLDLPLRTYSSGMRMRLAFAVSTAIDADILLLDEVIGVGDASFQEKANARLHDLHNRAQIVVLAIHSNDVIRRMCNKVIWLEHGHIKMFGSTDEVLSVYEGQH